ncbi:choline/ethanolamine kinase family protein [Porticoccus hydrocarbonoclasticus]|uniref:choline/ethanolamine kinase family protein n=1 Tax=Porticoccus hydrocarbonoclasticus TaxID=1073414 RepID=UPI001269412F|nr:choline/ethanolamine kinase family protein [Porticoccus hydrocarbonoclasticus]
MNSQSLSDGKSLLHQTLSEWRRWEIRLPGKPSLVKPMSGGMTNLSYLVESGSRRAVVRVNTPHSKALGIDRQREEALLRLLQPTGCVPKLLYVTAEVLVTEFVDGRLWDAGTVDSHHRVNRQLVPLLEKIRAFPKPATASRFSYLNHCQHYLAQLVVRPVAADAIEEHAAAIDAGSWQPVICHHDLIPENIIDTGRGPVILDWEYAAWGHPGMDLIRLGVAESHHSAVGRLKLRDLQRGMDALWLALTDQLAGVV